MTTRFATFCLVGLLAAAGLAGELPEKYMPVSEVKAGMTGVGRSVFRGTQIEEFAFEVIDVMKNAYPQRDMIVVRLKGEDLERSGVSMGMSGSPCYIDGRMIGALSSTWAEAKLPIGGVTPIEYMLDLDKPGALPQAGAPSPTEPDRRVAMSDPHGLSLQPIQTPVFVAGCSDVMIDLLAERLRPLGMVPVQGGGVDVAPDQQPKLEPGSMIGVPLLSGDVTIAAMGTVTEVVGDTVFSFGHDLSNRGAVRLPMATGYVVTVVPRQDMSFKLSAPVETVGTIAVDRLEGVVGHLGEIPRMVDVTVRVNREDLGQVATYRMKAVDDWSLTARMLEVALGASVTALGELPYDNTVEYSLQIESDEIDPPIVIENMAAGTGSRGALDELMRAAVVPAMALNLNRIHRASVTAASYDVTVKAGRRSATIENVWLDRKRAKPGETVIITARLKPFRGEPFTRQVSLAIPDDMPPGPTGIEVCDAMTMMQRDQQDRPDLYEPQEFDQLVALLRIDEHRGKLFARISAPGEGLAVDGVGLPALPESMRDLLSFPRRTGNIMQLKRSASSFTQTEYELYGDHGVPIFIEPKTN